MLVDTHFPAAKEEIPQQVYWNERTITFEELERSLTDWINEDLVRLALRQFKPGKAVGPDGFKPVIFKYLPDNMITNITVVYKACILLHYTPIPWRKTKIVFLPKPGKDTYRKPKSFRPISLSNYLIKGLERLMVWDTEKHLKTKPLHPKQHGFTKGKATDSALSNTANKIEQHLFNHEGCIGIFLDISSAFDSISVDHIRNRLLHHGANEDAVGWYHNLLKERHLEITLQEETVYYHTGTGFPQGGVASAKFWNIAFDEAI